jgi:hypothetical protein
MPFGWMENPEQIKRRLQAVRNKVHSARVFVAGMRDADLSGIESLLSVAIDETDRRLAKLPDGVDHRTEEQDL